MFLDSNGMRKANKKMLYIIKKKSQGPRKQDPVEFSKPIKLKIP